MDIEIRPVDEPLKSDWRRLYDGYASFYKRTMTDEIAETVWRWIHDPAHELEGIVAVRDGRAVGLAHFRRMPSPLRGADIGFLDDLFVDPAARGGRIGERLLLHLAEVARTRGWGLIRWHTADDNYRARSLYDRVARKAVWNVYELTP